MGLRLRTKLLLGFLLLEALLMVAVITVVERQERESILNEFLKRGLSVTRNLEAVNRDFVITYNYVKIDQNLERVVENGGLLYATVVFFDGEVASFKGREAYRSQVLEGELANQARRAEQTLIQYDSFDGEDYSDITVPIYLKDEKWGVIRTGFSLSDMNEAIESTRKVLILIGVMGLLAGYLVSLWFARRITRPIAALVESVKAIIEGDYQHNIHIGSRDEIGYLGHQFMLMRERIARQFQQQMQDLAEANQQLSTTNSLLEGEIIEREKKERQISYLAFYDSVTGLPNRAFLKDYLAQSLAQARHERRMMAVMFLDLDHFKRVNDTLGHDAGDQLLQEAARRLGQCVIKGEPLLEPQKGEYGETRPDNMVARLGGDEFVVLLNDIDCLEQAGAVAASINQALAQPFEVKGQQAYVSSSIGISLYPADGEDVESLLKHADMAMYHAKEQGRNNYQIFTLGLKSTLQERLELENELRRGLEEKRFEVFYQMKADTCTGQIVGMEALVRWRHPRWGLVAPAKFIPLAEETGLIVPLGEEVLRLACARIKEWQWLFDLRISVNVSAVQLKQEDFPQRVQGILEEAGVPAHCLELELTESMLMENIEFSIVQLQQLKDIGVKLSVDDLGTGFSSLSYIQRVPFDFLKIDRSFIKDIGPRGNSAIVNATIAMGHGLGLKVLAEGV
ncbi:MAG: EAL domain-containing protein, partial [Candidatus Competibacteraceae bacterium]|nr:EAL domain-containing protein [Candidatus Competibacteraceae bacterium]